MQLKDILAKIAKGETPTEEERGFAASFDVQAQLDAAAGAARKKAEAEAKAAKDALAKLQGEFDDFRRDNDPDKGKTEIQRLTARLEKLEASRKAAEEKAASLERNAAVRRLAREHGLNPAKGVDPKTLDLLVDNLMGGVDLEDADAVKAAFDGFKGANAALIAAGTIGGAGQKGTPGAGAFAGKNPFAEKSLNLTEQMRIATENPALAASLAAEAGVKLDFSGANPSLG